MAKTKVRPGDKRKAEQAKKLRSYQEQNLEIEKKIEEQKKQDELEKMKEQEKKLEEIKKHQKELDKKRRQPLTNEEKRFAKDSKKDIYDVLDKANKDKNNNIVIKNNRNDKSVNNKAYKNSTRPTKKDYEEKQNNYFVVSKDRKRTSITYSLIEKGHNYSSFSTYASEGSKYVPIDNNKFKKPKSCISSCIMLDTGQKYIPGFCYDHHQYRGDGKLKAPSASKMAYDHFEEIYEKHKDDVATNIIVHKFPDNDAICSAMLTTMAIKNKGVLTPSCKVLSDVGTISDTFTYEAGYTFSTVLDSLIKNELSKFAVDKINIRATHFASNQNNNNISERQSSLEIANRMISKRLNALMTITEVLCNKYDAEYAKNPNIKMTDILDKELDNNNSIIALNYNHEWKTLRRARSISSNDTEKYNEATKDILEKQVSIFEQSEKIASKAYYIKRLKDTSNEKIPEEVFNENIKAANEIFDINEEYSYDLFTLPLVKMQKEEDVNNMDVPYEQTDEECSVYVYTGNKPLTIYHKKAATDNFNFSIIPEYEKDKVTYSILLKSDSANLGDLSRYVEAIKFRDSLNESLNIKEGTSPKNFSRVKKRFLKFLDLKDKPNDIRAYKNDTTNYSAFKPIIIDNSTNFSVSFKYDEINYNLVNFISTVSDYLQDPYKIDEEAFKQIVGEKNYDYAYKKKQEHSINEAYYGQKYGWINAMDRTADDNRPIVKSTYEDISYNNLRDLNIKQFEEKTIDNVESSDDENKIIKLESTNNNSIDEVIASTIVDMDLSEKEQEELINKLADEMLDTEENNINNDLNQDNNYEL